jgi:hypothetical protein
MASGILESARFADLRFASRAVALSVEARSCWGAWHPGSFCHPRLALLPSHLRNFDRRSRLLAVVAWDVCRSVLSPDILKSCEFIRQL